MGFDCFALNLGAFNIWTGFFGIISGACLPVYFSITSSAGLCFFGFIESVKEPLILQFVHCCLLLHAKCPILIGDWENLLGQFCFSLVCLSHVRI